MVREKEGNKKVMMRQNNHGQKRRTKRTKPTKDKHRSYNGKKQTTNQKESGKNNEIEEPHRKQIIEYEEEGDETAQSSKSAPTVDIDDPEREFGRGELDEILVAIEFAKNNKEIHDKYATMSEQEKDELIQIVDQHYKSKKQEEPDDTIIDLIQNYIQNIITTTTMTTGKKVTTADSETTQKETVTNFSSITAGSETSSRIVTTINSSETSPPRKVGGSKKKKELNTVEAVLERLEQSIHPFDPHMDHYCEINPNDVTIESIESEVKLAADRYRNSKLLPINNLYMIGKLLETWKTYHNTEKYNGVKMGDWEQQAIKTTKFSAGKISNIQKLTKLISKYQHFRNCTKHVTLIYKWYEKIDQYLQDEKNIKVAEF
jgi:hypothetical protein